MPNVSRILGILTSLGALVLYVVLAFFNPYSPGGLTLPVSLMMLVAIAGAAAAYFMRPYWMLVLFAISFVPIGLYMLGTPGIFRLIGIFDLFYLLAGILMLVSKRTSTARANAQS
jgi:hypothetical protein